MYRYILIFLSVFAVLIFFLTPNINTGDAGELITASYFLGTAHPSAYPLYLQIGKAFSFLPFGNMAFKIALVSAIFSSLSLTLFYHIVRKVSESNMAAIFSVVALLGSYSFFTQSVIAKFYPLNLFLILLIVYFWVTASIKGYDERTLYLTAFVFGLIASNHHTGMLMIAPVFALCLFYRASITWKAIRLSLALFLSGFIINSYIFIRGSNGHFFNTVYVNSFEDFYRVLFRIGYSSSSLDVAGSSLYDFRGYWYALKNFLSMLTANFSMFSYPLFFTGVFFLYTRNRRILLFAVLALLFYGPFLAKLTLSGQNLTEYDYYVSAHQYFLPGIAFYVLFLGMGFCRLELWLKRFQLNPMIKLATLIVALFPLVFLISRSTDSNYRTDHVPYQVTKDTYAIMPANSILLSFADDTIYQGWYMKLVGRYREDICQLGASTYADTAWKFQGCSERLYGKIFPEVYKGKMSALVPLMLKNRFYATNMVTLEFPFEKYLYSRVASLVFLYLPKDKALDGVPMNKKNADRFLYDHIVTAEKLINPDVCLSHFTDDLLTRNHCNKYAIHLFELAACYTDEKYGRLNMKADITIKAGDSFDATINHDYDNLHYAFDVTSKNQSNVIFGQGILEHNQWKNYYIRRKQ